MGTHKAHCCTHACVTHLAVNVHATHALPCFTGILHTCQPNSNTCNNIIYNIVPYYQRKTQIYLIFFMQSMIIMIIFSHNYFVIHLFFQTLWWTWWCLRLNWWQRILFKKNVLLKSCKLWWLFLVIEKCFDEHWWNEWKRVKWITK